MNLPEGYNFLELDKVDSTNEEAKRLIKNGKAYNGLVIIANEQNAGRGRYGRAWESPKGNLCASIILKLDGDLKKISQVSFVGAVSVGKVLAEILSDCVIEYKWPNDVLVNKEKISGILLESVTGKSGSGLLVIGVGINIDTHPEGLPTPVTSIKKCGLNGISARELLEKFISSFDNELNLWQNMGFKPIRELWLSRAYKLNEKIDVNLSDIKLSGTFKGISEEGELELFLYGETKFISSGEVFF